MINYKTEIDTIALQIDCKDVKEQQYSLDIIRRCIVPSRIASIKFNNQNKKHEVYYGNTVLATIKTGFSYSSYYIRIRFAGLKRYNDVIDHKSKLCLMLLCGWLKSTGILFRLVELDIAIDIFCPFYNILVACTRKTPHVAYNDVGHTQYYDGVPTSYIEAINSRRASKVATSRSYLYNKSSKEGLNVNVTRFELKLQNKYFKSFGFNAQSIIDALSKYHVMYFSNLTQKRYIINKLNSYQSVHRREINRLGLEGYRLYPNAKVIKQFIYDLNSVYIDFNGNIALHP